MGAEYFDRIEDTVSKKPVHSREALSKVWIGEDDKQFVNVFETGLKIIAMHIGFGYT